MSKGPSAPCIYSVIIRLTVQGLQRKGNPWYWVSHEKIRSHFGTLSIFTEWIQLIFSNHGNFIPQDICQNIVESIFFSINQKIQKLPYPKVALSKVKSPKLPYPKVALLLVLANFFYNTVCCLDGQIIVNCHLIYIFYNFLGPWTKLYKKHGVIPELCNVAPPKLLTIKYAGNKIVKDSGTILTPTQVSVDNPRWPQSLTIHDDHHHDGIETWSSLNPQYQTQE